ncbi:MAG: hypothetical protein HN509_15885 [Halobacteriovoraceae bacterium]|nr:hypothetical protein [Halobacteriovoraceae bacterium]MBT5094311.1 hypothetical protein [Halobacteriovoraceae bacterium]
MKKLMLICCLLINAPAWAQRYQTEENNRGLPTTIEIKKIGLQNLLFKERLVLQLALSSQNGQPKMLELPLQKVSSENGTVTMKSTLWYHSEGDDVGCSWSKSSWIEIHTQASENGQNLEITKLSGHFSETEDDCHYRPVGELFNYRLAD